VSSNEIEFWRLPRVKAATGLSKTEIYRQVMEGRFPRPKKYPGSTMSYWLSTDVRQWQADLLARADERCL